MHSLLRYGRELLTKSLLPFGDERSIELGKGAFRATSNHKQQTATATETSTSRGLEGVGGVEGNESGVRRSMHTCIDRCVHTSGDICACVCVGVSVYRCITPCATTTGATRGGFTSPHNQRGAPSPIPLQYLPFQYKIQDSQVIDPLTGNRIQSYRSVYTYMQHDRTGQHRTGQEKEKIDSRVRGTAFHKRSV